MNKRLLVRRILIAAGAVIVIVFLAGATRNPVLPIAAAVLIVTGATDFGRQCPLILSARHLLARLKNGTKYKPPEL